MFLHLTLLILGLAILIKSSNYFVVSSSRIAKMLGIPEFIIGLTVVAVGTSIPELASSIAAAVKGHNDIVLGNVIGSNIANICLILGIAALFNPISVKKAFLKRDGILLIFVSVLFLIFAIDGKLNRVEAAIMLSIYLAYVLFLFGTRKKYTAYNFTDFVYYYMKFEYFTSFFNNSGLTNGKKKVVRAGKILVQVGTIILSCAAIIFSADLVVDKAVTLATLLKVNERIIGLTVIAIGTSLPELSVTILAATKGYSTIAVGNIVGSNIANILLVLGISASLKAVTIDQTSLQILIPLLIATSSFFVLSISKHGRLEKREGLIFIGLYGIFLIASLLF